MIRLVICAHVWIYSVIIELDMLALVFLDQYKFGFGKFDLYFLLLFIGKSC